MAERCDTCLGKREGCEYVGLGVQNCRRYFPDPSGLGPTGNFPEGKLHDGDEGELKFAVVSAGACVILDFNKKISWIGMPPSTARLLAETLVQHAEEVEGKTN
jgi:hypothetical protein